jgi:hypothetical protein
LISELEDEELKMPDIAGVSIVEITAFGWSEDGQHIWITHKLSDGSEYRLVYPYVAAGHLITMLTHAARSASARRIARNPLEATEGMDSNVIPIEEVRIGTSEDNSEAILHLTTTDNIPIAVGMPAALLGEVAEQSRRVLNSLQGAARAKGQIH